MSKRRVVPAFLTYFEGFIGFGFVGVARIELFCHTGVQEKDAGSG